ncbi:MerR family transcriptional regulator [Corticibacter populi]|uniref:MerR family transcriptional regulator n=1 Tax=Corticibacter populi TaxID=1550736 RepID=A0A3M6QNS1_9BURK|nr:chaperone modulator CbpM [Corticibacter populi]RMX04159.1 MerR family transcriptional regulator [Corticibacter populi]RZS33178.1 chaperone modulatory protein CbpM [Corticibacter populi]
MTQTLNALPELLDAQSLTITEVARACQTDEGWIIQRVTTGVLQPDTDATPPNAQAWRFSSRALLRARRIAELERTFDADPQLAALTADLMEEVRALRRQLAFHGLDLNDH